MMASLAHKYLNAELSKRIMVGTVLVVILNAVYCLAYRYASGNPATLFEAFSWGIINIAPWIAAFEIGRSSRNKPFLIAILGFAFTCSLGLEAALHLSWPTGFDAVRRIPAAILIVVAFAVFRHLETRLDDANAQDAIEPQTMVSCDWVVAAGNYVEMHRIAAPVRLARSSLTNFIKDAGPGFIRVHRRYAVCIGSVERQERNHVVMRDGTRVPVGDRYRSQLAKVNSLVPSSQTT